MTGVDDERVIMDEECPTPNEVLCVPIVLTLVLCSNDAHITSFGVGVAGARITHN